VIVVGSGVAGLSSALAAAEAGARVALLERATSFGGTTAVSGGGIWMPGHHHLAEVGVVDSREEALAYMGRLTAGRTPTELLERYVDTGPGILAELERVTPLRLRPMSWPDYHPEMDGAKASGRMLEPGLYDKVGLGTWGSALRRPPVLGLPMTLEESTVDWRPSYTPERFDADTVQRRRAAGLVACGQALVGALLEACLARGVAPHLGTRACELVQQGDRVAGVVVELGGRRTALHASAVVLACGGFEWDPTLRSRYLPGPLTHPHSPPTNLGDGLRMAMALGADLANMNEAWWYPAASLPGEVYEGAPLARFVGVERTAPHSIMVNRFGERFVNEAANYNDMQKASFSFDTNSYAPRHVPCWVVFDRRYREHYPVVTTRPGDPDPGWLAAHQNLEGLAQTVGIDPVGLAESVERWNTMVRAGHDRDFGRGESAYDRFHGDPRAAHPNLGTLEAGPFYALPVHVGSVGTKGGPRVDADGRVQHVADRPVPGLYGAGNVIASPAGPAYYGGGTSIGLALVWGRLAGAHAGRYATGAAMEDPDPTGPAGAAR
jgi:succinate dehydrogenase/fumarate reductase flavoprotein subunit